MRVILAMLFKSGVSDMANRGAAYAESGDALIIPVFH